jgi:hypothetical protein
MRALKTAGQLAERVSLHLFSGPEPASGVSDTGTERAISGLGCRQHQEYWQSVTGHRHAKSFLSELSANRTVEFLKLNRSQARQVTSLLTGHCHLK